ncbi:hypothetical protein PG993_013738 [Apiospora rasikravindrae]|uniref:Rhodopsin domain-containing protein n=1 Tax=Apiospora rasikravindrae TaxID=990691 RepID=A0ABR1RRD1_9PEZI
MTNAEEIHKQHLTVGVMTTCLVLATASYALRVYARLTTAAKIWYDDWWMSVVMVISVAMSTSIFLGLDFGSGTHQQYLPEETVQSFKKVSVYFLLFGILVVAVKLTLAQNLYVYMILWSFGVFAVKVGILLFYWRVFTIRYFRRSVLAVGALSTAILLVNFFTFTFQCWPIERFWDESVKQGGCIAQTEFYLASAIINVVGDVVVLVLPLPVVWSLHTSQNKKWSLSFLFLLGAFVCVASIFRILAVEEINPKDFTFSNVGGGLWSTVEVEVGFICANLPSIRPPRVPVPGLPHRRRQQRRQRLQHARRGAVLRQERRRREQRLQDPRQQIVYDGRQQQQAAWRRQQQEQLVAVPGLG